MSNKVCIAKILTAHGVRGLVKVDCYLEEPSELKNYNPLTTADGKSLTLTLKNSLKGLWLAEIDGVNDRTIAERYRNTELFIDRESLPEAEDGHYILDLVGLDVQNKAGAVIGKVLAVENFGASDLLEIKPVSGKSYYLPMIEPYVSDIDPEAGFISVDQVEDFQQ